MRVIRLFAIIALNIFGFQAFGQFTFSGDSLVCDDTIRIQAQLANVTSTDYAVVPIPHNPYPLAGGFSLDFTANPKPSGFFMPFSFCYFGDPYNIISNISESGWVSFSNNPNGSINYNTTPLPAPGPATPINAIMGVWSDHGGSNCGFPCGYIQTGGGVAPFRRAVISFLDIPHNSCSDTSLFQIVLYETTNIIEVHISHKSLCATGVGGGAATVGIQNSTGTLAHTPPNRNATVWTAVNESWRFVPNEYTWTDAAGNPIDTGFTLSVLPTSETFYVASATDCSGATFSDTVFIRSVDSIVVSGGGNYSSCSDSIQVTATDPVETTGRWFVISGGVTIDQPDSLTTWIRNLTNPTSTIGWLVDNGCDTIIDTVSIFYSPPNFNFTDSLLPSCPDDSSGQIFLNFQGGNQPFTYNWSAGSGNPNLGAPPGAVFLTVTDSLGCSLDTSFIIGQYPTPIIFAGGTNVQCFGDSSGSISGFTITGGPFEYALNAPVNFQANSTFPNLPAGSYALHFRDTLGCIFIRNGIVAEPDSFIIGLGATVDPVCGNDSTGSVEVIVSGALPPYEYSLDTINWQNNDTLFNLPAGTDTVFVRDNVGCITFIPYTLTAPPPLVLSVDTLFNLSCFNDNSGQIELEVQGGIPPYNFSDDNLVFIGDSVFTGISADTFSFYVSDNINCRDSIDVIFTQPDSLTVTSIPTNLACSGDNNGVIVVVETGGTGPYQYVIGTDTSTNPTFANLTEGSYPIIEVIDANGCVANTNDSITAPPPLIIDSLVIDSALCNTGNQGQIAVSASGGTVPYLYSLDSVTFQGGNTFGGLTAGTYTVYVQDNNLCVVQTTATIFEPPPSVSPVQPDSVITNVSCNGQNDGQVIIALNAGVPPIQYSIDGGANYQSSDTFSNLTAGNYSVLVLDANGCIDQTTFTITEPAAFQLVIATTPASCFNGSDGTINVAATGGTTPYIYSVDNGNNFQPGSMFSNLSAGTYDIVVIDSNGCSSSDTAVITEPTEFIITALPSAVSCFGYPDGSVEILTSGGTPPYTAFSISDDGINFISQNTNVFTGLTSGNYVAVASDANGCPSNTTFDILEPPLDTFDIQITPTSCFGSSFMNGVITIAGANVNAPYLFSLDGGNFTLDTVYPGLSSGLHTLIWENVNGCLDTLELWVDEPDPILVFVNPDTLVLPLSESQQVFSSVVGPSNVTYQWLPSSGLSCSDCPDPVVSSFGPSPLEYTLLVEVDDSDANPPCFGEGSLVVLIEHEKRYFFPNAFTPNGDGENEILYVYGEHIRNIDLQIFDRWGNKVFASTSPNFGWDGRIKGTMSAPGVFTYFLTVEYLDGDSDYEQGSITLIR